MQMLPFPRPVTRDILGLPYLHDLALPRYALAFILPASDRLAYRVRALSGFALAGNTPVITKQAIEDFAVWVITRAFIVWRTSGYVLFYQPGYYLATGHRFCYLGSWMSFHGARLG